MLSALIPTKHSYPAMPLVEQLVHQRFVPWGPLVLSRAPLNCKRTPRIKSELSHDALNPARVPL